ncbi:MAG: NADH-quinone oxidoreductase subunit NuoG [Actinomycetota bacterium]|nr:NADH-quinone oxidoreductase subunit NuoG [Actinomycetota bacterium]
MAEHGTVSIIINGVEHDVPEGERLITAAERVGEYIPRFCHHDKLAPVGKCRMCLVEVEGPRGSALTTSCTVPVTDGMVVHTETDVVKKAQEGILEFLLLNHPLDCSVCDKGGECPLQDQALAFGAGESRFIEEKRTFTKPIPVSELVLLDRERCVVCDRCVRVADDIAGDPLIELNDRGSHVQINTFPNEPFSSYFSGNTVQVCPVGALTSVDYRFKARPWDLESVRSVSLVDSVQSSVDVHTSRGKILRVYGAENDAVNEGWLSDKDRFIFSAFRSPDRITTPLVRDGDGFKETSWSEAIELVAMRLGGHVGTEVGAIGGANGTNEEAFALAKFMRTVVGSPHIDAQLGDGLDPHLASSITARGTISDLDAASTILVWGPDLKETLPVLYLRVRKAVRNGAALVVVSPYSTGLDSIATHSLRYRAGSGPEILRKLAHGDAGYEAVTETLANGPVVALVGRSSITENPMLAEAVAAFARSLPHAKLLPLLTRANVFGALDMGLAPTLLPGRVSTGDAAGVSLLEDSWGPLPESAGKDTMAMLEALIDRDLVAVILAGADPIRDCPDPAVAESALDAAEFVVAFDAFMTDSTRKAHVILPAALWGEVDGTVTNLEGRVQRLRRSVQPRGMSISVSAALDDIARAMGAELGAADWQLINKEIAAVAPAYAGMTADYLTFEAGEEGAVVPIPGATQPLVHIPVEVNVPVVTGRFTLHLAPALYDAGVLVRNSHMLEGFADPGVVRMHPRDAASLAVADGDLIDAEGVGLPVKIDPEVPERSVVITRNLDTTRGIAASADIRVETVRGEP